jgi:hypothetical protein
LEDLELWSCGSKCKGTRAERKENREDAKMASRKKVKANRSTGNKRGTSNL